ncbi:MAG: T9SS type A sorting domain-containing protein [Ignavibacteriae bacterium]|nr:T9SS type A sorting domain-containing protein [Ignavibacteriota bacterium]
MYANGYVLEDTLQPGIGYWLKFSDAQLIPITGKPLLSETLDVFEGWNIVGSISIPVPTNTITSDPGGIVTSDFFGYNGGYRQVDTIEPGHGYWVKVSQNGKLILSSSSVEGVANRIRIVSSSELPPAPPEEHFSNLESQTPNHFALEQNYPNPFNPVTVIRYQLPVNSWVTLKVYNVLGQEVATLVNEKQEAGRYEVEFDGSKLSSGVYFYRFVAGNFVDTKKLLLVR